MVIKKLHVHVSTMKIVIREFVKRKKNKKKYTSQNFTCTDFYMEVFTAFLISMCI